jgi:hypothetical protein
MFRVVALSFCLAVLFGCGEEGKPGPGYADPCETPMGPVLGCPPGPTAPDLPSLYDACQRLVTCGILAAEWLGTRGDPCSQSSDCPGGQCLPTSDGDRCHYHRLDYRWCTSQLAARRTHPCDSNQSFTDQQVEMAVRCIVSTPCNALGLSFEEKLGSSDNRPDLDKYTCKDGENSFWTATICDHGLLRY